MTASSQTHFRAANQPRWQFSLGTLLLIMALVAVVSQALRDPNELWAGLVFMAATGSLLVAALWIVYREGGTRAFAVGFLIFGGAYFLYSSGEAYDSALEANPELPTSRWAIALFHKLHDEVVQTDTTQALASPGVPSPIAAPPVPAARVTYNERILPVAAVANSSLAPLAAPAPAMLRVVTQTVQRQSAIAGAFLGVVHRALALLLGVIGGVLGQTLHATRRHSQ